ncbi:MAG: hypothetical protein ACKOSQ_03885 [Planctomycetaceae bacterium]
MATLSVPPLMVVTPPYVLEPESVRAPAPLLTTPPLPLIVPEMVCNAELAYVSTPLLTMLPAYVVASRWPVPANSRVPVSIVMPFENLPVPDRTVSVALPVLVKAPVPLITPEKVPLVVWWNVSVPELVIVPLKLVAFPIRRPP